MLVKRLWETVSNSSTTPQLSSSSNSISSNDRSTSNTGRVPDEILVIILKKLGPKETTKLCTVCKTWRDFLSSDNHLWIQLFQSQSNDWESIYILCRGSFKGIQACVS